MIKSDYEIKIVIEIENFETDKKNRTNKILKTMYQKQEEEETKEIGDKAGGL